MDVKEDGKDAKHKYKAKFNFKANDKEVTGFAHANHKSTIVEIITNKLTGFIMTKVI
jgi:hypothetical protein